MKRIVASVGLVAVGASGLQAAMLPGLTTESGKPWTVAATLRGFYDDNVSTVANDATIPAGYHRGSTGFEISPSLQFSFPMEQTTLSFGYVYSLKYYENKPIGTAHNSSGGLAGLLNEVDNVAHLDGRDQFTPQTTGIVGYQFRDTEYTGNQVIGQYIDNGMPVNVMSDERNARSHYVYAGIDENFRPDLTGSVRAGGRYTEYYNNPAGQGDLSPYAMASLRYTYLPESFLEAGFTYDYSASSVFRSEEHTS